MSWRTTSSNVQGILVSGINYDPNIDLTPFIDTANALVDQLVSDLSSAGLSLASALLIQVETYLAAHFYCIADPMYQSKSTQGASAQFQGQTGMGLDASHYGQTAKRLDVTGTLAGYDRQRMKASVLWLGKPKSDQLTYVERNGYDT